MKDGKVKILLCQFTIFLSDVMVTGNRLAMQLKNIGYVQSKRSKSCSDVFVLSRDIYCIGVTVFSRNETEMYLGIDVYASVPDWLSDWSSDPCIGSQMARLFGRLRYRHAEVENSDSEHEGFELEEDGGCREIEAVLSFVSHQLETIDLVVKYIDAMPESASKHLSLAILKYHVMDFAGCASSIRNWLSYRKGWLRALNYAEIANRIEARIGTR